MQLFKGIRENEEDGATKFQGGASQANV